MKTLLYIIPLLWSGIFYAQKKPATKYDYPAEFRKISDEILLNSNAYENLRQLTKDIGPRFSGSAGYDKAVDWAMRKFSQNGGENIRKQNVKVPIWIRGKELVQIKPANGTWRTLRTLALGGSEGTGGKDLTGEILLAKDFVEFNKLKNSEVKDKIVFFNYAFDQTLVNPGDAYAEAGKYRWSTPSSASRKGAKAVLTRAATSGFDDVPHTGSMY